MYGHPSPKARRLMKRHFKAQRLSFFLSRQHELDLGENPVPVSPENARYLRAFTCLDEHKQGKTK